MIKRIGKKKDIDFLLDNKHYKRLHLILYFISLLIIISVYFMTLVLFSTYFHFVITIIFSFLVGFYLVLNRSVLVKVISNKLDDRKRKKYKQTSKQNLKTTIRKITPKNKRLKLNIKGKVSLKEKVNKIKSKFKKIDKKAKKRPDYIEIK